MINHDQLRETIIDWNIKFPYDHLWRKKYNVSFNSEAHKGISFLDQLFDIEEERFFDELINAPEYVPNIGDWIKVPEATEENFADSIKGMREEFKDLINTTDDE